MGKIQKSLKTIIHFLANVNVVQYPSLYFMTSLVLQDFFICLPPEFLPTPGPTER